MSFRFGLILGRPVARNDELTGMLRELCNSYGGWNEKASTPCHRSGIINVMCQTGSYCFGCKGVPHNNYSILGPKTLF